MSESARAFRTGGRTQRRQNHLIPVVYEEAGRINHRNLAEAEHGPPGAEARERAAGGDRELRGATHSQRVRLATVDLLNRLLPASNNWFLRISCLDSPPVAAVEELWWCMARSAVVRRHRGGCCVVKLRARGMLLHGRRRPNRAPPARRAWEHREQPRPTTLHLLCDERSLQRAAEATIPARRCS